MANIASSAPIYNTNFNQPSDTYTREFYTIDVSNTIGDWVDAFNKNALASTDHKWYLNEMLYNGLLYTGLETIGGVEIKSLTNLSIASATPESLELDNWYVYFRNINKIKLLNQVTFDLSDYADGEPHFFYLNSDLGYRVSQDYDQHDDEVQLFRFYISPDQIFRECYITTQRFGSDVYDAAKEYFDIRGVKPVALDETHIKLEDGTIKRSGIRFDYHQVPDVLEITGDTTPKNIRYITADNKVDFSVNPRNTLITNKALNYETATFFDVPDGKFTAQRILYDVYSDCLIFQYGHDIYDTIEECLTSINSISYPFPYNSLMFIPLGEVFIKSNPTNLKDVEQAIFVQQLNTTINPEESLFFAEDAYARGRCEILDREMHEVNEYLLLLKSQIDSHKADYANPHRVTKTQVGLGNVENYSFNTIKQMLIGASTSQTLDERYVNVSGDTMTGGLTINHANGLVTTGKIEAGTNYIKLGNRRLYLCDSAPNSSLGSNGDYALYYE